MKVTNRVTIELTVEEAVQLAKILKMDIYNSEGFEYKLKEQICESIGIKYWDL